MKLNELTANELIKRVNNNETSVWQICNDCLQRIKERNKQVKAWEYLDEDIILKNALALDDKKKKSANLSKLGGIPVGIKDVFNTKDFPTAMGSEIWAGFTPGNDARVVHNIRENDGIVFGKTVTAEFAVHYLSASKTTNPHNPKHIPGTSSSGSAAAVADFMVPLALGTQTAGSIIRPSSYCGVFGFKPTFGTVPRTGTLKTTDTLDTIGCIARSVDDIKLLFDVIRVKGKDYPFVYEKLRENKKLKNDVLKIGYIIDGIWVFDGFEKYTIEVFYSFIEKLKRNKKISIEKISPSQEFNKIHKVHTTIYDKDLSYYFNIEFKSDLDKLSKIMLELIENGNKITAFEYLSALDEQARIRTEIDKALGEYDIILTPSVTGEAPLLDETEKPDTCLIWTFLGYPALNVPLFKGPNNLPLGLQAVSKRYDDYLLLSFVKEYINI